MFKVSHPHQVPAQAPRPTCRGCGCYGKASGRSLPQHCAHHLLCWGMGAAMNVVLRAEGEVPNRLPLPEGEVPSSEAPPAPPTTAEGAPAGGRQGGSPLPSRLTAGGEVPGGGRAGWAASCSS